MKFLKFPITPSAAPSSDYDVANKKYVDDSVGAAGGGDMMKATYDPNSKNADAFNADNHVSGTTNKVYTATEQTKLSGIDEGADNVTQVKTTTGVSVTQYSWYKFAELASNVSNGFVRVEIFNSDKSMYSAYEMLINTNSSVENGVIILRVDTAALRFVPIIETANNLLCLRYERYDGQSGLSVKVTTLNSEGIELIDFTSISTPSYGNYKYMSQLLSNGEYASLLGVYYDSILMSGESGEMALLRAFDESYSADIFTATKDEFRVTEDLYEVYHAGNLGNATTSQAGLMSTDDKTKLNGIDLSGYVPTSRTVNSKALSSDITLTAADVGATDKNVQIDELPAAPAYYPVLTQANTMAGTVTNTVGKDSDVKINPYIGALYATKLFVGDKLQIQDNGNYTDLIGGTAEKALELGQTNLYYGSTLIPFIGTGSTDAAAGNHTHSGYAQTLVFTSKSVLTTAFVSDSTYTDYDYKADVSCTGVTSDYVPTVNFNVDEAEGGNFAPVALSGTDKVTIYAKEVPSATITIPSITCIKAVS